MPHFLTRHFTYANVASTTALVLVIGGGGAAVAAGVARNSVGSPQIRNGQVKTVDIHPNAVTSAKVGADALTGADIKESTLGSVPKAATADKATTALNVMTAVIRSDGTLNPDATSLGAVSSQRLGTGTYQVNFNRDVTSCSFLTSMGGLTFGTPGRGFTASVKRAGSPSGLFIQTADAANTVTDANFVVAVIC